MLTELAKPVALLLSLLSLYAVFHAAFLGAPVALEDRILHALNLLVLAAGIAVAAGLLFREPDDARQPLTRLSATLPIQLFCWSAAGMLLLFLVTWYLETHTVLYRDIRF